MRLVTWNVQHGGGKRAEQFAERLAAFDPDVVVITEFRNNQCGKTISSILKDRGIAHFSASDTPPTVNTVVIGAKKRFNYQPLLSLGPDEHRCVCAKIEDIAIFGLYFPQREKKVPVFQALCNLAPMADVQAW